MPDRMTQVLLRVAALVIILWALRAAEPIAVPLVFALFLMGIFWPVFRGVRRLASRGVAVLVALLTFLIVLGGIGGGLYYSGAQIARDSGAISQQLGSKVQRLRDWAEQRGLPIPSSEKAVSSIGAFFEKAASRVVSASTGLLLAFAFLALSLLEARDFRDKLVGNRINSRLVRTVSDVAIEFQRYIAVRTFVGLLTGLLVGLGAWAIGLDYPVLWGVANFLLNYFPTIGSVIGVFPPTLYALAQSDSGAGLALATLGVIGGVQLLMGNYIDPLIQGRVLSLSPLVVLLSVVFWGWMWGVAGAFIGVPITIATVLVCRRFESTRWIATLLAETGADEVPAVADDLQHDKNRPQGNAENLSDASRRSVDEVAP